VIAQLNLPWRDVLDAIERATPSDVALLSLEPDAAKQSLKGMAEAKDPTGMIGYIESLQQQDFFSDVALLRHETNEADTHKPVRFQFDIRWQGRAP
jgi:Tfp pilus assembly protein PilN